MVPSVFIWTKKDHAVEVLKEPAVDPNIRHSLLHDFENNVTQDINSVGQEIDVLNEVLKKPAEDPNVRHRLLHDFENNP